MLATTHPFSFVLFGASGNLAKLKIYPSLYILALKKRLPEQYAIVGYARTEMDDAQFRELVRDAIVEDMKEVNQNILENFLSRVHYYRGEYDKTADFAALATKLTALEHGWEEPTRLAYFSIPPAVFTNVLEGLEDGGVHVKGRPFRCIMEKPVGHDSKSFEGIRTQLMEQFTEDEIYLLDHYLGKDAVRNIYYLRYANPILERIFKNSLIHHVEIDASESLGLEGRAGYFDSAGTLQDFFQSHLLMMASLLTMRIVDEQESFRAVRLSALEQFYLPPAPDMDDIILQGQYTAGEIHGKPVPGYLEEEGVAPGSRTNTFIALKLLSRSSSWQGVPFYFKSGKRLDAKETRVSILFQEPHPVGKGATPNRLDIIMQGEAGLRLHLQTKLGGMEQEYRPLIMTDPLVCVGDCLPEHGHLLLEAFHGSKKWFLTFEEIRATWRLIDPLQAHLNKKKTPLYTYPAGCMGPKEADAWIEKDGAKWF
jgi:glucose-6-phosphate 1-dehydrogenase